MECKMKKNTKAGLIIIAVGVCIPLALLFFISGYKEGAGFIANLLGVKIVVGISDKLKIGIPYRFFLAIGVFLVFIGIRGCFDKARTTPPGDDDLH
jgi:hypothetical protein